MNKKNNLMKKIKKNMVTIFLFMFAFIMIFSFTYSIDNSKEYKLLPENNVVSKNKREITMVFWLGCPHCHQLNKELKDFAKKERYRIKYLPVSMFTSRWEFDAKVTLFAMSKFKTDNEKNEIVNKLFDLYSKTNNPSREDVMDLLVKELKDKESIQSLTEQFEDFPDEKLKELNDFYKDLKINSVPELIIEGNYITNNKKIKNNQDYFKIVKELTKK